MSIPCCFYPTQVILLDDDTRFLESMNMGLGKHNVLKLFNTPQGLIDYLTASTNDPFTKRCIHRPESRP